MNRTLQELPVVHEIGAGAPLVLLHCLGVDHRMWRNAGERLSRRFRVLTYDLPGHGKTAVPSGSYTIADLAEQLETLLTGFGIQRAHIAGMSLGGLVAQEFAARYPTRVDRLVLIDTTPQYPAALKAKWVERAAISRTQRVSPMIDEILTIWFTPEFGAANGPTIRYVRETLAACQGEGYALACEALGAADLRESAKRIGAPTLILLGDGDLPPFHDAADWLRTHIAGSQVRLIANARHAAPLEQPGEFVSYLEQVLDSES